VQDTGPGIPPGERETMFEPFLRRTGGKQGAGLGLAVRGFAEVSGARLWAEHDEAGTSCSLPS
jgi:signal transduction histidine kinase